MLAFCVGASRYILMVANRYYRQVPKCPTGGSRTHREVPKILKRLILPQYSGEALNSFSSRWSQADNIERFLNHR